MKKNGKISYIAKTLGFKLEGEEGYLNPAVNVKPYIKNDLIGKSVELDIDENTGLVTFLKVDKEFKGFNNFKKETPSVDWDGKEKRMVRMNVLNRAVEIFVSGKCDKTEIFSLAGNFERWVYNEPLSEEISIEDLE